MATQLLLLKDIYGLGQSGEVVNVKPGYARNYLLPRKLAMIATKQALQLQERLKEDRRKQTLIDKQESEEMAVRIEGLTLTQVVKVDQDGHMYGSVTVADILDLLQKEKQVELDKKDIQLKHPIKTTGVHSIVVKLKEDVTATFNLKVISEESYQAAKEETAASGS